MYRNYVSALTLSNARCWLAVSACERSLENGHNKRPSASHLLTFFFVIVALTFGSWTCSSAQNTPSLAPQPAMVVGTVTDLNGGTVPGATVVLFAPDASRRTATSTDSGFFQFDQLKPGGPYHISITAAGLAEWRSPDVTLEPGQYKIINGIQLRVATAHTTVNVTYDPVEVQQQQFKAQEKQRILGFIPNFFVAYDHNPEPLTSKMKFKLALKTATDPVTIAGVALFAGIYQAADTPNYGQGVQGYAKRFGSVYAGGFTDVMIGGAILPSLLHQDPRYFFQGTGTTGSRTWHAIKSPFVTRGDNGKWQPNYSSLGGDLATAGIANLWYPASDRSAGRVFTNFGVATAERIGAALVQEFLLGKLTHRGGHIQLSQSQSQQ